jgi:hypothetical protein
MRGLGPRARLTDWCPATTVKRVRWCLVHEVPSGAVSRLEECGAEPRGGVTDPTHEVA